MPHVHDRRSPLVITEPHNRELTVEYSVADVCASSRWISQKDQRYMNVGQMYLMHLVLSASGLHLRRPFCGSFRISRAQRCSQSPLNECFETWLPSPGRAGTCHSCRYGTCAESDRPRS